MLQFSVRQYRKKDRPEIMQITERSFEGVCLDENIEKAFGKMGGLSWRDHKKSIIDYDLGRNAAHTFVAEADGKVIGYVCTRLYREHAVGHVANLAVAPEFQGLSVGKSLMNAALKHFKENGMLYARIETLEQNYKAAKFYASLDFQEMGRQIYYLKEL